MSGHTDGQRRSLIIGGPFYGLLKRLRLLGADQLPAARAGVVLAAVAWLLPAALAVLQNVVTGDATGLGFFSDPSVPARFLVGIFVFICQRASKFDQGPASNIDQGVTGFFPGVEGKTAS